MLAESQSLGVVVCLQLQKSLGAAADSGKALEAYVIHPVVDVHFRQTLLGGDIDILGNGVQLVLPHGSQQAGGRNGRKTHQDGNDGNHHQHFRQGKAPGGSFLSFGCVFRVSENSHSSNSPSENRMVNRVPAA